MVIIRCNAQIPAEQFAALVADFQKQAEAGLLVLPAWCELLSPATEGDEIVAMTFTDAQPQYCTGCDYMKEYAERAQGQNGPTKLICPYHFTLGGPWTFCPCWPYNEKQEAGNG